MTMLLCIPPFLFVIFSQNLVPQPLSLPDLFVADFYLFTKLKSLLKGRYFESVEEIKENSLAELHSILKEAFQECF
jgi:hypothetical protein